MTESERRSASEKYYQELREKLDERIRNDRRLNALSRKIAENAADFNDTAQYSELVSNHIGAVLQENIGEITSPLAKEFVCTELLKDQHSAINETLGRVQVSIDEKKGIHLNPQKAPFPFERVRQVAHALEDPTVKPETIRRRANAPVANVAKSFHDDYIRTNAKLRNDLGLKPVIQRYGANCCAWCSAVAGKYRFGEQPEDIFRRHDNCNCVIIYDTQVLRGKQTADGGRSKTWEEIGDVPADYQPTVFTHEQAKAIEQRNLQYMGLTNGNESGKIKVESELGKFKEKVLNDDRMSKDYYNAVKTKFSHGSDDAKALFNKYVNGNSVENANYMGTAFFNPDNKKISMNYHSDLYNQRGKCATWFHEHGHLIDDAMNNISNNKEFRQCLNDDWLSYMKAYGKANNIKTIDKVQTAISKDLSSMRKHSAVSDILEGVSKYGIKGCAGHRVGYWTDDSILCSEAFAHMYEAQFDKTRYDEMQKYFPSALSKFEEMIKEGAK